MLTHFLETMLFCVSFIGAFFHNCFMVFSVNPKSCAMKFKFHMNLRPVQMMKKFSKTLGDKKDGGFVDAGLQVEFLNYFWVMNLC